jgi:DNA-binding PadR family transcriptional regulator
MHMKSTHQSAADPRSFLPLTPLAFQVLLALADTPRHGYGVMREVDERTDGLIRMRTGTLYVLLSRLVEQALIAEIDPPADAVSDARERRYYDVTPLGRAVLQAEARRLASVVDEARRKRVLGKAGKS